MIAAELEALLREAGWVWLRLAERFEWALRLEDVRAALTAMGAEFDAIWP